MTVGPSASCASFLVQAERKKEARKRSLALGLS